MAWTEIGGIKSETSRSRVYSLETDGEELRCSCPAYIHAYVPKSCKHTQGPEAGRLFRAYLARVAPAAMLPYRIERLRGPGYDLPFWSGMARASIVREDVLERLDTVMEAGRRALKSPTTANRLALSVALKAAGA